jgi:hypothetical protein
MLTCSGLPVHSANMASIDIQKLATVPYLDLPNLAGRTISTLMFHDAGQWRLWLEAGGALVEVKAWSAEYFYFAKDPADPDDIFFHFLDFMAQRACFPEIVRALSGIHDDVFNLSASLVKIEHIHATRAAAGSGCHRMVATEIEYIFMVCRSIFDLLQEIALKLWATIQLVDPNVVKKPLKESFNAMVNFEGKPATGESLMRRFGLPPPLADFYVAWREFFTTLRDFRDNISHNGSQIQSIFTGTHGFQIAKALRPFHDMDIWRPDERETNEVVPLMPALGVVISRTLGACEEFSQIFSRIIAFPPPIAPGMRLFMRGYFNQSFNLILRDAADRISISSARTQDTADEPPLP